jgi:hypothetical protein
MDNETVWRTDNTMANETVWRTDNTMDNETAWRTDNTMDKETVWRTYNTMDNEKGHKMIPIHYTQKTTDCATRTPLKTGMTSRFLKGM